MVLHVISVGGSLIVPEDIDLDFLKNFKVFIKNRIKKGDRFILIAGGGKVCRKYQNAAKSLVEVSDEENDLLGIYVTKVNAYLLKSVLGKDAHPKIIEDPVNQKIDFKESVLVGSGWKPGCSTDLDAVLIAKRFDAKSIINLSNIDYVYDSDPKINPNAKKIKEISWKDFRKIVGNKWDPGLSAPFDPIASKEAQGLGINVAILNGKKFDNLNDFLDNKEFIGTLIR